MKPVDHEMAREQVRVRTVVQARAGMAEAGTPVVVGLGKARRLVEGTGQVEDHSQVELETLEALRMARRSLVVG